jgi:large subunit ribosomal protein L9
MELILLEKVLNLGDLGDKVTVKPGYGRNYLVPQGKAVPATAANLAEFEKRRAELEKAAMAKLSTAEERVAALQGFEITLTANASDEGKLYGSIGPREIADAVSAAGPQLEKAEVIMGEGPIRYTGEHQVLVQLHADVEAEIKVIVNAE